MFELRAQMCADIGWCAYGGESATMVQRQWVRVGAADVLVVRRRRVATDV
jgi:hypothetical protein